MVEGTAATPGGHHQPEGTVALHIFPRGHAVALRQGCHLVRVGLAQPLEVRCLRTVLSIALGIAVTGHDVHAVVARIPVVIAHL